MKFNRFSSLPIDSLLFSNTGNVFSGQFYTGYSVLDIFSHDFSRSTSIQIKVKSIS